MSIHNRLYRDFPYIALIELHETMGIEQNQGKNSKLLDD